MFLPDSTRGEFMGVFSMKSSANLGFLYCDIIQPQLVYKYTVITWLFVCFNFGDKL